MLASFSQFRQTPRPKRKLGFSCRCGLHAWLYENGSDLRRCRNCDAIEVMVDEGGGVTGSLYAPIDSDAPKLSWWTILIGFLAIVAGLMLIASFGGRISS